METAIDTAARLTAALERLAAEEAGCAATEAFADLAPIQARIAPVVEQLVVMEPAASAAVRQRIGRVLERRAATIHLLAAQSSACRDRLRALDGRARTLRRVGPAYGGAGRGVSHLQAIS